MRRYRTILALGLVVSILWYFAPPSASVSVGTAVTVAGGNGSGSAPAQLSALGAVVVDSAGNVYVADTFNHRVQKWAPGATAGTTVAGGNGPGSAADQLDTLRGLAIDSAGSLYIADTANHRIQKWVAGATSGTTVAGTGTGGPAADQLWSPHGVVIDGSGALFIADTANHRIQRWAAGAVSGTTVAGGNGQGNGANQFGEPTSVAVDSAGNVYIADSQLYRVQKWAPGAATGTTVAGGNGSGSNGDQLDFPAGVTLDSAGNLYVADLRNNRVQKFASGATSATTLLGGNAGCFMSCPPGTADGPSDLEEPRGVALDSSGNLYVADTENYRVQKLAAPGGGGASPGPREVIGAYAGQGGFEGAVSRLYMCVYRTQPDPAGHAGFVARLQNGVSLQTVADEFAASAQFASDYGALDNHGFIAALYLNVLNRPGEPSGVAWWLGELRARPSRSYIMLQMCQSAEFLTLSNTR